MAMVGHSLGEYVAAACVAGAMSLEEALRLVARRAALIAQTEAGALLTVALPAAEVAERLPEELALSGVLTPAVCVVGGREMAVRAWAAQLQGEGISCRLLPTDHAYHTPLLASIQEEFRQLWRRNKPQPPQLPYLSNVTGDWIMAEQATDPAYWAEHLCQPVQMAQALGTLLAQPETVLLEVGAGQALAALVKQHPGCERERMNLILPLLPGVYEAQPERAFVLTALGKLWLAGVEIAWTGRLGTSRAAVSPYLPIPLNPSAFGSRPKSCQRSYCRSTRPRSRLRLKKRTSLTGSTGWLAGTRHGHGNGRAAGPLI